MSSGCLPWKFWVLWSWRTWIWWWIGGIPFCGWADRSGFEHCWWGGWKWRGWFCQCCGKPCWKLWLETGFFECQSQGSAISDSVDPLAMIHREILKHCCFEFLASGWLIKRAPQCWLDDLDVCGRCCYCCHCGCLCCCCFWHFWYHWSCHSFGTSWRSLFLLLWQLLCNHIPQHSPFFVFLEFRSKN